MGFGAGGRGDISNGDPLPYHSIVDGWHKEREEPWGHGVLGT